MQQLTGEYDAKGEKLADEMGTLYAEQTELRKEELLALRRGALTIEQSAIQEMLGQDTISDIAYRDLIEDVDKQRQALEEE